MSPPTRGPRFPLPLDELQRAPSDKRPPSRETLRPQRPLHHAAVESARRAAPSGLGLDSATVRARMVRRLQAEGIDNDRVLQALGTVERHRFVDSALANQAYEESSLPIGHGQTISRPSVVARMLALLLEGEGARENGSLGRVLEVGTGCGYQTSLLSLLARSVVSIERLRPLHEKARSNLHGWRHGDVRLLHGDGRLGHAPWAPYDSIIAAAAGGETLPEAWLEQLAPGGRLVAPVNDTATASQVLLVVDRGPQGCRQRRLGPVHFVPLESGKA